MVEKFLKPEENGIEKPPQPEVELQGGKGSKETPPVSGGEGAKRETEDRAEADPVVDALKEQDIYAGARAALEEMGEQSDDKMSAEDALDALTEYGVRVIKEKEGTSLKSVIEDIGGLITQDPWYKDEFGRDGVVGVLREWNLATREEENPDARKIINKVHKSFIDKEKAEKEKKEAKGAGKSEKTKKGGEDDIKKPSTKQVIEEAKVKEQPKKESQGDKSPKEIPPVSGGEVKESQPANKHEEIVSQSVGHPKIEASEQREETEEPVIGASPILQNFVLGLSAYGIVAFEEKLRNIPEDKLGGFARIYLMGPGSRSRTPKETRELLQKAVDKIKEVRENAREEILDEVGAMRRLVERINREGVLSVEDWVVGLTPEELRKHANFLIKGEGSRLGTPEEIRKNILEAISKQAELIAQNKSSFQKFWESLHDRSSKVRIFGRVGSEFIAGAAAGFVIRKATRVALTGIGGLAPAIIAGGVGGGVVGGARAWWRERSAYNELLKEMQGGSFNLNKKDLYEKVVNLDDAIKNAKGNPRIVERLMDKRRYTLVAIKKEESEERKDTLVWLEEVISTKASESLPDADVESKKVSDRAEEFMERIDRAKLVDRKRLRRAILRGATIGALGGLVGGVLVGGIEGVPTARAAGIPSVDGDILGGADVLEDGLPKLPELPNIPIEESVVPADAEGIISAGDMEQFSGEVDTLDLESGDTVWGDMKDYMGEALGRDPSSAEVHGAVSIVLGDNDITWEGAHSLSIGTEFDVTGANEYIHGLLGDGGVEVPVDIASLPAIMEFEASGYSSAWGAVEGILENQFDMNFTSEQIQELTKIVAEDSDIGVPEWGVQGSVDHRAMPVGYKLQFTSRFKEALGMILLRQ